MPSSSFPAGTRFQFNGFYLHSYPGGPERPFVRVLVTLPIFKVSKQIDMLVDSGSDVTTLQPKDTLLMLDESQFKRLGQPRLLKGIGGYVESHTEEGALGFSLPDRRICWVPVVFDITNLKSGSTLFSTLDNDIMQFGIVSLDAIHGIITIELWLTEPLITSS